MKFLNIFKNKNEIKSKRASIISANSTLIDLIMNTSVSSINDSDIDMILNDLTVTQCDVSRKAVTEKKEIQIITEDETLKKEFKNIFNPDVVSQVLETYLYGLNVFEINYKEKDGFIYPRLVQRDFRKFKFNDAGEFVFHGSGSEQEIPPFKVIYALNRANFKKQYGDGLLKKLYFPVKMKNASLKFWYRFLERFGSPWAIAKTSYDPDELAKEVDAMLSGDSAVIDKDEELELIQPTSNVDFSKLPNYFDTQISKAILGANLTSDVKEGSYAAAQTHNEIREDLAANDAKILVFVINRAIDFFKEINGFNGELSAKLFDEDAPNTERASRDKVLFDMGFVPTQKYIKDTYNIELDEEKTQNESLQAAKITANKTPLKIPLKAVKTGLPIDKFDKATDELEINDKQIELALNKFINESETYEEAFEKLYKLYDLPFDRLEEMMFRAIANAQMAGYYEEQ